MTEEAAPEALKYQVEDLQRKLEAQSRELKAKEESAHSLQQRFRDLHSQIRDLEQRAGVFHREASSSAEEIRQTEETLKVCDLARAQLSAALERQGIELSRWQEQGRALNARVEELEGLVRRRDDTLERLKKKYEDACRLLAAQSQA